MESRDLNKLLVDSLPELSDKYQEAIAWQDGEDTGSHVIYGDVLNAFLRPLIYDNQFDVLQKYFNFIEMVLSTDDDYAEEVIAFSVLEHYIEDSNVDKTKLVELMGTRTRKWWDDLIKHYGTPSPN